jgi:Cof subfamily protein (haloacid dehalogenase superfamily)
MKYKLLVLDIDGTLTNSQKEVTEHTRKTLKKLQEAGVKIALASGRPTCGILPIAKQLELEKHGGFILSFNGGKIQECGTGRLIYEKTLPGSMTKRLYDLARSNKVNIITYQDEYVITEDADNLYVKKELMINKMKAREVDSFVKYVDFPVTKCLMVEDGDYLAEVESRVKAEVGEDLSVYRSEPFFLEIMPRNIDKAHSLKKLLDYMEITKEEMVACGDGFNDVTMIEYAGLGVAMENAQDAVKKAADYIAPANDEDGVAFFVNKFMLS